VKSDIKLQINLIIVQLSRSYDMSNKNIISFKHRISTRFNKCDVIINYTILLRLI